MATSDFWQKAPASATLSSTQAQDFAGRSPANAVRGSRGKVQFWMCMDAVTVVVSAAIAILYRAHTDPLVAGTKFWRGTLIHNRSMEIFLVFLCGFTIALIITSRRLNLYSPTWFKSIFQEQGYSVQACLTSGLLLTGALYLVHAEDVSRAIVLVMIGLVTVGLSLRRLIYRLMLYHSFERGVGTRNVLIVGTGPAAHALRYHMESMRYLGYTFKGFIDITGSSSSPAATSGDVVGTLDTLFQQVRKRFVDEIFFTTQCERSVIQDILNQARAKGVDLRLVPDIYDGLTWNSSIEYIGHFPTIPLHRGEVHEVKLLLKRTLDIVFSSLMVILLFPILLAIAIAIKLDSQGPIFYLSNRIGKKGRVFRCIKFRTMVEDAEKRRAKLIHKNERDGVLFKITDDPRITRLGRFLRKYSLDELPQFFNVLRGDMSVVGPRPPISSEVREYKLSYLRRLDVTPGITGLWQVQARQDPSFDSYISLDMAYIENWSIWLDFQIILRTVGVVFAGTGS
jgi:exopolysaccharide biosynthesis polyprenyl glycosylphosphotransferase